MALGMPIPIPIPILYHFMATDWPSLLRYGLLCGVAIHGLQPSHDDIDC